MNYRLFLADPAVHFLNNLDEDDRKGLIHRMRRLADQPGGAGDFHESDVCPMPHALCLPPHSHCQGSHARFAQDAETPR